MLKIRAQGFTNHALILALIAIVVIVVLGLLSVSIPDILSKMGSAYE